VEVAAEAGAKAVEAGARAVEVGARAGARVKGARAADAREAVVEAGFDRVRAVSAFARRAVRRWITTGAFRALK
jgi:hypothetical protein